MKAPHLTHVVWAIVAIAAFAIGSWNSDSESEEQASAKEQSVRNSRTLSSRSRGGSSGAAASRGTGRTRSGGGGDAFDIQPGSLSEGEIRQLGVDLKSATNPLERREIFSRILANLTPENAKLMREQIVHLDTNSSEFRDFHYQWGALAGEEAVLAGAESPERDMATTLSGWASANPDAALAYFNGLEPGEQNGSGLKWGAISGLARVDPNLAVQFAMDRQQAGDREATRLVDYLAREVIRTGDPANAASWASTLPAGDMQDAAVRRVAEEFAEENPAAALDWANTLPQGNGRNRAMRETFSEWAREDPQTAATRLSALPESPERDSATYGYATRVAWEDPVAGIEWANTIGDGATRARAIMDTGRAFFRRDPEAARRWLPNSGLNEQQQRQLLARSRGRG
jgi:hypothetical protein